jgi:hypothetical protein
MNQPVWGWCCRNHVLPQPQHHMGRPKALGNALSPGLPMKTIINVGAVFPPSASNVAANLALHGYVLSHLSGLL